MKDKQITKEFLYECWQRSQGEWVFSPYRNGAWVEGQPWRPTRNGAWEILRANEHFNETGYDVYFTPLRFRDIVRKNQYAGSPGVLFADLDEAPLSGVFKVLKPTALWETSPGRTQAIWFLNEPMPDMEQWRNLNRDLTYAVGADKGGWMQSKVLRIPGSKNWKRGGVQGMWHGISYATSGPMRYLSYDFDYARKLVPLGPQISTPTAQPGTPPAHMKQGLLQSVWDTIPLSAQYWLTVTPQEYAKVRSADRSKLVWHMTKALHKKGLAAEEIYWLIKDTPWNKWKYDDKKLWADINRILDREAR